MKSISIVISLLSASWVSAQDPALAATSAERMAPFQPPDFVLNLKDTAKQGVVDKNDAGQVGKMNVKTLPTLRGQKLSMTLIDLEPW
jgi:hypothetical protein